MKIIGVCLCVCVAVCVYVLTSYMSVCVCERESQLGEHRCFCCSHEPHSRLKHREVNNDFNSSRKMCKVKLNVIIPTENGHSHITVIHLADLCRCNLTVHVRLQLNFRNINQQWPMLYTSYIEQQFR